MHPTRKLYLAVTLTALFILSLSSTAHAQISPAQKPILTTLHRFDGTHGAFPYGPLILGQDGNWYGTTANGGVDFDLDNRNAGGGTLFKMTPQGKFTTFVKFVPEIGDSNPHGALTQLSNGDFIGAAGSGIIFQASPKGTFSTVFAFPAPDQTGYSRYGSDPQGNFFSARDGSLYGTAEGGGYVAGGSIFKIGPDGVFSLLYSFSQSGPAAPGSTLVQGTDDALYGTTMSSAYNSGYYGTVFRLTTAHKFQIVHNFDGHNGAYPGSGLTVGADGSFYGVTTNGGIGYGSGGYDGFGTAFKISQTGHFTLLHKFSEDGHGLFPIEAPVLGPDGNLYGTTIEGGAGEDLTHSQFGYGTIYKMTPTGKVTTLYKFHPAPDGTFPHGYLPSGRLVFGPDGALYGLTSYGGYNSNNGAGLDNTHGYGTIYKLILPQ